LAILADFGKTDSDTIIKNILQKIKDLPIENSIQKKTVTQFEVLSKLRKLQPQIIKHITAMALTYNIEDDVRYKQGEEKGELKRAVESIMEMLKDGLAYEKIAKYAKVSKEFVEEIAKQIKK